MSICGIVCEYNPFHTGHLYHIEETKRMLNTDSVICVMSPNFVQRGEPALFDKWLRTKHALLNGVSIVIELPTVYATASAELFAAAAVTILHKLNIITHLSFGAEDDNLCFINTTADILLNEPIEYKNYLSEFLKTGMNFPSARFYALQKVTGNSYDFLKSANNILALEYVKALKRLQSNITPFIIKRSGSLYNDIALGKNFSSATAIRNNLADIDNLRHFIPQCIIEDFELQLKNKNISNFNNLYNIFQYIIKTTPSDVLSNVCDISEGFHNRILRQAALSNNIEQLVENLNTKRFTKTRIQRMLLHILLNIKKDEVMHFNNNSFIPYIRVLGFKKDKEHLIKQISKSCNVPVITNYKQINDTELTVKNMLGRESTFTDIYNLSKENNALYPKDYEYQKSIVIV